MLRAWWRSILGTLLVLGGLATAVLTYLARRTNDWELTRWGAILSLVFIALITIFVLVGVWVRLGAASRWTKQNWCQRCMEAERVARA